MSHTRLRPLIRQDSGAWVLEFLRVALIAVVASYFVLPGKVLLLGGWQYLGGGPELEKIHISTYLLFAVFGLAFLLDLRFRTEVVSVLINEVWFSAFSLTVGAVACFAIVVRHVSAAPFVDTFAAALVVTLGCLCIPTRYLAKLRLFLEIYFGLSVLAIFFEYYAKSSILFFDQAAYIGGDFRAKALFEGPLSAATCLGIYSLVLLVSTPISFAIGSVARLSLSFLCFCAVFATGGRTALLGAAAIVGVIMLAASGAQLARGYFNRAGLLYGIIAVPAAIMALAFLYWLGLFDTMLERFHNDIGSAMSRQIALDLISSMSVEQLWFGLSAQDVLNLVSVQAEYGLIAIEISWVNFVLVCGLIFTVPLFIVFVLFLFRFIPRYCGIASLAPALFLLINVSASNGIWSKTTILTTSLAIIFAHMRVAEPEFAKRAYAKSRIRQAGSKKRSLGHGEGHSLI